jgi:hypothetical protein
MRDDSTLKGAKHNRTLYRGGEGKTFGGNMEESMMRNPKFRDGEETGPDALLYAL